MKTRHFVGARAQRGFALWRALWTLPWVLLLLLPGIAWASAVPSIQELQPPSAIAGGGGFTLTVSGSGIDPSGQVSFGGTLLSYTGCSGNACKVTVPAALIAAAGTVVVTVVNPGSLTSNSVLFPVAPPETQISFGTKIVGLGSIGKSPQGIARGDFNGDGFQDIAVVNSTDNTVTILLSDGGGNFTPAVGSPITVGHNPQGIVAGDFDNNGIIDLAVTNENDNTVSILLGNGSGGFAVQASPPATDIAPVAIAAADVNQDGKLDLLVVNQTGASCGQGNGSLSVLEGDGTGKFSTSQTVCLGILPASIVVADLNGDGLPEVVVNNQGGGGASCATGVGSITVLINFGGIFDLFGLGVNSFCAGPGPTALAAGDFNNDGKIDIAVANVNNNAVSVLLGNGDGSFQSAVSYSTGGGLVPSSILTLDINGDGILDLAVANQGSSNVSIMIGNGDGTFQESPASAPPSLFPTVATVSGQSLGRSPVSIVAADVNGDGRLDLLTADNTDNVVSVMFQAPAIVSNCYNSPNTPPAVPSCVSIKGSVPSLLFGNQPEGTTSAEPLSVQITNTGSSTLMITSLGIVGNNAASFEQTNTCGTVPAPLAAGASCIITATFSPSTIGSLSGASITVGLSNGVSESVANLSGSGLAPVIGFSPLTVSFPATLVGTTNTSPVTVTVSNIGDFPTAIEILSIGGANNGDFSLNNDTCSGFTLPAGTSGGGTCTFQVTFTPSASGLRTGFVAVPFMLQGSSATITQYVPLSGDGAAPAVLFSPTPLTFGNQPVSTTSTSQTVTLLNDGTYALTINSVTSSAPSEFTIQSNNCTGSLAVSTSCTVAITFTPQAAGTRNANLVFTDNNNAVNLSQQTVGLVGTGAAGVVSLAIAPATFGNQQIGTTSGPSTVTLSNLGNGPLTIASVTKSGVNAGDFSVTGNTCPISPAMLAISASCTVTLTFTPGPGAPGLRAATLTFTDNNNSVVGSQQSVALTGTATAPAVSLVGLSGGTTLAFGGVPIGTTSAPQSFTIANTGTAPLVVSKIVSSDAEYLESDNCRLAALPANGTCTVTVTFTPLATGPHPATLTITDNNGGSPIASTTQTVNLTGTGTSFSISASPASATISPGKFESYTLTLTPISGFTGTVTLGCSVTPAQAKTTCTTPISVAVNSPSTMFISASAKNSSKGTFKLTFTATFTATAPATGTLTEMSVPVSLTVK